MEYYQSLFTLVVKHSYFTDGFGKSFDFQFDKQSLKLIDNSGAIVKQYSGSAKLLATSRSIEIFELLVAEYYQHVKDNAEDGEPIEKPALLLRAHDKTLMFNQITSISIKPNQQCFFITNELKDIKQNQLLHESEYISDENLVELTDKKLTKIVTKLDWAKTPILFIKLYIEDLLNHFKLVQSTQAALHYIISFNTKENFWKYLIFGHEKYSNLTVLDIDNIVVFNYQGKELIGNKESMVYLSDKPIVLKEKFFQRFQLRNESQRINRILVKRLPVASTIKVNKLVLDGKQTEVSEIFVNL